MQIGGITQGTGVAITGVDVIDEVVNSVAVCVVVTRGDVVVAVVVAVCV